jgi:hypothetical protein
MCSGKKGPTLSQAHFQHWHHCPARPAQTGCHCSQLGTRRNCPPLLLLSMTWQDDGGNWGGTRVVKMSQGLSISSAYIYTGCSYLCLSKHPAAYAHTTADSRTHGARKSQAWPKRTLASGLDGSPARTSALSAHSGRPRSCSTTAFGLVATDSNAGRQRGQWPYEKPRTI